MQVILMLHHRGKFSEAADIGIQTLSLLPLQESRTLSRRDQQAVISEFSDVAAEVCSISLKAGDEVGQAMQTLEMGRGAIIGLMIEDRADISELRLLHSDKASQFDRLRHEVNLSSDEVGDADLQRALVDQRITLNRDLNQCLQEIRLLPGFERFLRGPTVEDMKQQSTQGPIIIINISQFGSDAIITSPLAVKSLRLPDLCLSETQKWLNEDQTLYRNIQEFGMKNKRYCQFLSWLWAKCVKPVLEVIRDGQEAPSGNLPRIWWIGAGIASFLPFHAAGDHSPGSTDNTFCRAISSYITTIKTLAYARARASLLCKRGNYDPKVLAVTMPTTPGEKELSGVVQEVIEVRSIVEPDFAVQELVHPDTETVLSQLQHCDIVHFACHGVSDVKDPSNSHLILHKKPVDLESQPAQDPLTVEHISKMDIKRPRIAYLSACSTAENKTKDLADEVIHLVTGFQVAGFPHVIGSL